MSDIFISYARSTEGQAKQIAEALRALGYGVWRDDEIPANRAYADVIRERLKAAKAVVVIWSAEAAASEWVRSEAERARADRKLVQLSLDGAELPMPFDQTQCANLTGWSVGDETPGWKQVVGAIAGLVSPSGSQSEAPRKAARKLSICVLPFANLSGDPEQEYFSDGISEDITTDLSKVSALEVTARNTAFQFKGKSLDMAQLAGQLRVSHVLEGSVRKAGGRVRITAQLIDGASGNHLWAERWDRTLDDIFALQDEISQAIVAALKVKLLPAEKKAIEQRGTDNVEAYNHYLMARSYSLVGNHGDQRKDEAIERLASRAVEIDPGYALAWALLAQAQYSLRRNHGRTGNGGEAALDRALALSPDLAEARALKARRLFDAGRRDEATAEIEVALRLDPESYEVVVCAGIISYGQGQLNDAAWHFEKATLIDSNFQAPFLLISCYTVLGDAEKARRVAGIALERAEKALAQDRNNGSAMHVGVTALAALGEAERAKEWMNRALLVDPDNRLMRYNFACALASLLGDLEAALDMLGQALGPDPSWVANELASDPDLASLRSEPRFQAMLAQAQLAAAKPDEIAAP